MLVFNYKNSPFLRIVLSIISSILWNLFMYELYFLKGTSSQGYISPDILMVLSILLVLNFIYLNKDMKQIVPLMFLGLGLIIITIGSVFPLYMKCFVMSGILLISTSIYIFKNPEPNKFGYNQTPINNTYNMTGTEFIGNTDVLKPRIPLDYPNPSNI